MLVISRKEGEVVVLQLPNGDEIDVVIVRSRNGVVSLGFEASDNVDIVSEELFED